MNATTKKKPRHKVPDGIYPATLEEYQPAETNNGLRYQFVFSLDGMKTKDGQQITLMRTTSPSMAEKSHRRVIVEALIRGSHLEGQEDLFGNPVAEFESVKAELLIGTTCTLLVQNQKNKAGIVYSNIETVFPRFEEKAAFTERDYVNLS